ncbi:MAG: diacylglycerol kinase [Treponema sp.]|nr:diacylglycerol kinase [Treponema sp.]MCL2250847.1 diacylglycerol kinase [Treponema sp.]
MDYYFAQVLTDICQHSMVAPGLPLRCMVVVNPVAGGFFIPSKWAAHLKTLTKYQEKAKSNPTRQIYKTVIMNITEGKGSAQEITKSFVNRVEKEPEPFYLIISAGGDGTHGEVMQAIYNTPPHVRRNMAVLRLPLGTGNDGADSNDLGEALDLLLKPVHVEYAPAVQLVPAKEGPSGWKGPFLAFNILSVGLDAFVTHQTNLLKSKTKGQSYKFWIDIAALSYDKKYKVDYMNVRALDNNNKEILSFREKLLLLAMGVSGNRTYGNQQKILPDENNVCGIKQMPLVKKLAIKDQVTKGKHSKNSNTMLFSAHRVEFSCSEPILAQMDGETILLQPEDFPAVMELTAPVIPLLKMG